MSKKCYCCRYLYNESQFYKKINNYTHRISKNKVICSRRLIVSSTSSNYLSYWKKKVTLSFFFSLLEYLSTYSSRVWKLLYLKSYNAQIFHWLSILHGVRSLTLIQFCINHINSHAICKYNYIIPFTLHRSTYFQIGVFLFVEITATHYS